MADFFHSFFQMFPCQNFMDRKYDCNILSFYFSEFFPKCFSVEFLFGLNFINCLMWCNLAFELDHICFHIQRCQSDESEYNNGNCKWYQTYCSFLLSFFFFFRLDDNTFDGGNSTCCNFASAITFMPIFKTLKSRWKWKLMWVFVEMSLLIS